eukprot:scaffold240121_cov13-Tisochrysis_lutea.AAC.1
MELPTHQAFIVRPNSVDILNFKFNSSEYLVAGKTVPKTERERDLFSLARLHRMGKQLSCKRDDVQDEQHPILKRTLFDLSVLPCHSFFSSTLQRLFSS